MLSAADSVTHASDLTPLEKQVLAEIGVYVQVWRETTASGLRWMTLTPTELDEYIERVLADPELAATIDKIAAEWQIETIGLARDFALTARLAALYQREDPHVFMSARQLAGLGI